MSALYCTINDCAAKNKPTGRGHRSIAATVKDWTHSVEVSLDAAEKGSETGTWATITLRNLRTGEAIELESDELEMMFNRAKRMKEKRERQIAAVTSALLDDEERAFARQAIG